MISISCLFSDGGIFRGINLVVPHMAVPFCSKWLNSFLHMYQISLYKWLPFPYKTCNFGTTAPLLASPFPDLLLSAEGSFQVNKTAPKIFRYLTEKTSLCWIWLSCWVCTAWNPLYLSTGGVLHIWQHVLAYKQFWTCLPNTQQPVKLCKAYLSQGPWDYRRFYHWSVRTWG